MGYGHSGQRDVLITDVNFPDGDALDLLPRLQEKRPDLTIIVMSAQANLLTAIKTQQRGVFDYLPKPFELRQLLDVMSRAISEDRTDLSPDRLTAGLPKQIPAPLMGKIACNAGDVQIIEPNHTVCAGLIKAEPGSGKQIVAQTLHEMSHLSSAGFEAVELSQVEEAEHTELLFGPRGLITRTSVGSLFLNNIDQLSVPAQKALAQFMVSGSPGSPAAAGATASDLRDIC